MSDLTKRGRQHVAEQIQRFKNGKLLRASDGTVLNPDKPKDVERALAIFYSEARAGEKRGFEERTYKGSTRMRPRKVRR